MTQKSTKSKKIKKMIKNRKNAKNQQKMAEIEPPQRSSLVFFACGRFFRNVAHVFAFFEKSHFLEKPTENDRNHPMEIEFFCKFRKKCCNFD